MDVTVDKFANNLATMRARPIPLRPEHRQHVVQRPRLLRLSSALQTDRFMRKRAETISSHASISEAGLTADFTHAVAGAGRFENLHLHLTSDASEAATAYIIAQAGMDVFRTHIWLGAFQDASGTFYAYVKDMNGQNPLYRDDPSSLDDDGSYIVEFFKKLRQPTALEKEQTAGSRRAWLRLLHSALRFQEDTNLLDMRAFDIKRDCATLDGLEESFVLKETSDVMKRLSAEQVKNILKTKAFSPINLGGRVTGNDGSEPRFHVSSWGYSINVPVTPQAKAAVDRAIGAGTGRRIDTDSEHAELFSKGNMTDGELQIVRDPKIAARAYLVSRFWPGRFVRVMWIGEFHDQEGTFWAYVRGRRTEGPPYEVGALRDLLNDPAKVLLDWDRLRANPRTTPPVIRKQRKLGTLSGNLVTFKTDIDFLVEYRLLDDDIEDGNVIVLDGEDLVLDGEVVLKLPSEQQASNLLGAARRGATFDLMAHKIGDRQCSIL